MSFQPDLFAGPIEAAAPSATRRRARSSPSTGSVPVTATQRETAYEPRVPATASGLSPSASSALEPLPPNVSPEVDLEGSQRYLAALLRRLDRYQCVAQRVLSSYPLNEQVDMLTGRIPRSIKFQRAIEEDWVNPEVPSTLRHALEPPPRWPSE